MLQKLINNLLSLNDSDSTSVLDLMEQQGNLIEEIEKVAKRNNTILGRLIRFPFADGYAIYVITKVNKKTVRVAWIDYGDGWMDRRLGRGGLLDIDYAMKEIKGEDALKELFSGKQKIN